MNYLTLVNNVLNELNEIELTATTFGSSRGVQTTVKNVINKAINDIYNAEIEWPYLIANRTDDIIAGTRNTHFLLTSVRLIGTHLCCVPRI